MTCKIGNLITVFAALFAVLSRDSIEAEIAALSITYSLNVRKEKEQMKKNKEIKVNLNLKKGISNVKLAGSYVGRLRDKHHFSGTY